MTRYSSALEWFEKEIKPKVTRLRRDPAIVLRPAADSVHADQVKRIFEDGEDLQGKMGKYKSEKYKEFRRKKGRETSFVNLRLTGGLMRDYANGNKTRKQGKSLIASAKRTRNGELIRKFQEKYNRPFDLTEGEEQEFRRIAQQEFIRYMQ